MGYLLLEFRETDGAISVTLAEVLDDTKDGVEILLRLLLIQLISVRVIYIIDTLLTLFHESEGLINIILVHFTRESQFGECLGKSDNSK
jgi:hypothetical protein